MISPGLPMRTLIVDDHAAIRRGVRSAIENCEDVEIVGEAFNGEDAVKQTAALGPDLIIMDLNMPVLDGLTAAEIIKTYYPKTRIVMFSVHMLRDFVEIAKNLGLDGFVGKEDDGPSLRLAVEAVRQNRHYFPVLS
jgi:DNA-binding NarL/FixJ family response regulator